MLGTLGTLRRAHQLAADLLALPVAVLAVHRHPEAPDWMPGLWPLFGRGHLTVSALLYLARIAGHIAASGEPLGTAMAAATPISAMLNLAVVAYLWRSALVGEVFREFSARGEARP